MTQPPPQPEPRHEPPTPTPETVRRLVLSLLGDDTAPGPGPEVRPVVEGGAHSTWWVVAPCAAARPGP